MGLTFRGNQMLNKLIFKQNAKLFVFLAVIYCAKYMALN